MTWEATLDGALDHILKLNAEKDNAIDAIGRFLLEHPEFDADLNLTEARVALL
ncbi:hypothetical protein [Microbacterium sp. NPDC080220]|uniref:hypothetical protein n=1 Tax=Microbacterium sp. NPDC080220 TaxID=3161017 RepID=UPI00341E8D45